jgi:bifunctional NMN adenylyltransferase/nudix hydrolase
MAKVFDIAIIVGRFMPFHNGHEHLVRKGLELSDNTLVFLGCNGFVDYRHFIPVEDNTRIIKDSIGSLYPYQGKLHIEPIYDSSVDRTWVLKLTMAINTYIATNKITKPNICFIGSKKDILWYESLLPDWTLIIVPSFNSGMNATNIRKDYFCSGEISEDIPEASSNYLKALKQTLKYKELSEQFKRYYGL